MLRGGWCRNRAGVDGAGRGREKGERGSGGQGGQVDRPCVGLAVLGETGVGKAQEWLAAPEIGTWEEKTSLRGDTEACLEHGGCEGLKGHPEEGVRRSRVWLRLETDVGTEAMRVGVAALGRGKREHQP